MMVYRKIFIGVILLAVTGCTDYARAQTPFETLVVQTMDGRDITYNIEVADTTATRRHGLMYRESMPSNQGMLLDFEQPQKVSIWMKNTYLPLDIIYINAEGRITKIVRDAVPHSTALMSSENRVRAVLEVNAGQVDYHGIQAGDMVLFRAFGGQ